MSSTFKLAKFLVTCSLQHYPEWEQDSNTGDHHSTSNKFSYKIILRANEMAAVQLKFNPQDPHDSSRKLTLSSCVLISTHMLWHAWAMFCEQNTQAQEGTQAGIQINKQINKRF